MELTFDELKHKEVINIVTGHRLGFVGAVETDRNDQRLIALHLPAENGSALCHRELIIPWACIEHIGHEIIVVNLKEK